jgi:hypothetical protein
MMRDADSGPTLVGQMAMKLNIVGLLILAWACAGQAVRAEERAIATLPKDVRAGEVVVSADHSRVGWIAREELVMRVVVDGKKQQGYDWIVNGAVGFTADSKHVVYAARKRRKAVMVVDGKEGELYDSINRWAVGQRGGSVACSVTHKGAAYVLVDGVVGPGYEFVHLQSVVDGKSWAYVAERLGKQMAVINGVESKAWDKVVAIRLSGDGKRSAYGALAEGKWRMVIDGKEGERFDGMSAAEFSGDGRRVGYTAVVGAENVCVIDEVSSEYPGALSNFSLSADGARHLLISTRNEVDHLIVDEKEVAAHSSIIAARFSADGKHVAHVGRSDKNAWQTVFVDGKSIGVFDEVSLVAPVQSGGSFAIIGQRNGKYFAVFDGRESAAYDFIFTRLPPAFLDDGSMRFLALKGREIVQVTVGRSSTKAPT